MREESSDDEVITQQHSRSSASFKYCEKLDERIVHKLVKDLVRLALNMETRRSSMTREDAMRLIFKEHKQAWSFVFQKAQEFLRSVMGMEMVQITTRERKKSSVKLANAFILRSVLSPEEREQVVRWSDKETQEMKLLMIVLSLILGHGRSIPEETLRNFLQKLGIDMEGESEYFGQVGDAFKTLLSQGYLGKYKNDPRDEQYVYVWGPRSKVLFSESSVIDFMVSVMIFH
jgi:hypothetical protein